MTEPASNASSSSFCASVKAGLGLGAGRLSVIRFLLCAQPASPTTTSTTDKIIRRIVFPDQDSGRTRRFGALQAATTLWRVNFLKEPRVAAARLRQRLRTKLVAAAATVGLLGALALWQLHARSPKPPTPDAVAATCDLPELTLQLLPNVDWPPAVCWVD